MSKKPRSAPPTEEQKQKVIKLYDQNVSLLDIVKTVGITRYYVLSTLQDAGKWHGRLTKEKISKNTKRNHFDVHAHACWI